MYAFRDIIKSSLPENVIILVADEMLRQFVQTDARLVPESCLGTLPDISLTPEEKWLLVLEDHIRSFAKGQESFSCSISERLQAIIDDADNPDARLKQNARVLKRGIERDQEGNR